MYLVFDNFRDFFIRALNTFVPIPCLQPPNAADNLNKASKEHGKQLMTLVS